MYELPDGDFRGLCYEYRMYGKWTRSGLPNREWYTGLSTAECDQKAIHWLSTKPGGVVDVIIRCKDNAVIWERQDVPAQRSA